MDIILLKNVNKLRECRCNIDTLFILHALDSLVQHLLNDCSKIGSCLAFRHLIEIHKYGNKRRLSVGRHQRNNLILDHLYATIDFFFYTKLRNFVDLLLIEFQSNGLKFFTNLLTELLTAYLYKRCKVRKRNTLSAVLGTCDLCNGLCCNIAGSRETLRRIDTSLADYRSVL